MDLFDLIAGAKSRGEGLSAQDTAELFDALLEYAIEGTAPWQGLGLTKQQINYTIKQYRDRLITQAYVQLDGDMSQLTALVTALPRLGATPNSPAALLQKADRLMELPTSRQRLSEIINSVADDLEASETINILATELKGK